MWAATLVAFPLVTALNWAGAVAGIVLAIVAGGLAHEMGHAAVCLSKTGAVGSIRAGVSRVGPSFVVDITPIGQASRSDRILAYAFGPAIHSAFCGILVGLAGIGCWPSVLFPAAVVGQLRAMMAMAPLQGHDGWAIWQELQAEWSSLL
ncbi:hypothetical protein [Altererythrobacter sp. Root672]|uniref:hypothetical protein n=1 Tax=Altererythrobacter sp. Root672 TaxID=1736584 RepID=UPI0012E35522|nr:hypothetical protein [Altererythrobacter sp. Root672]